MSDRVDLRLALAAVTAWVLTAWAMSSSAATSSILATIAVLASLTAAVIGVQVGLRSTREQPLLLAIAFCCCAAVVVLVPLMYRLHRAHTSELAQLATTRPLASADLVVSADPHLLTAHGVSGVPRVLVPAKARTITTEDAQRRSVSGAVLVFGVERDWRAVLPGQRVRVHGRLVPLGGSGFAVASLSVMDAPQLLGRAPWWQIGAADLRAGLRHASAGLPADSGGLLPGLVDGDTSGMDPVLSHDFQVVGMTHLVAVSGTTACKPYGCRAYWLEVLRLGCPLPERCDSMSRPWDWSESSRQRDPHSCEKAPRRMRR